MKKCILTGLIIILILLTGCEPPVQLANDQGATPTGVNSVINANNQFTFDFYSKLTAKEQGNIFFSPYSISTALAMVYEGARGQTADEMQSVLHFPEDPNMRRPAFARIHNQINKRDKKYKLYTANALWAQKDYSFLNEYTSTIDQYYAGKVTNLDFVKETEKSRKIINDWVEDQTNNKIKDLFPRGSLHSMTRLVLTNAIYFKGEWVKEFKKRKTKEENFYVTPNNPVKVPLMRRTDKDAKFNYAETEDLQILEMLYKGEELSMLVLLPKENNINLLEESITAENLVEWKNKLRNQRVDVYMPKFTFDTKYFLSGILSEMGIPTAFSMNADFSGMDGTQMLFIDKVIHQAFVDVNEKGTEAAAATGISMALKGMAPQTTFRADHPFIFIIQERGTGNILFLGRVIDPTK